VVFVVILIVMAIAAVAEAVMSEAVKSEPFVAKPTVSKAAMAGPAPIKATTAKSAPATMAAMAFLKPFDGVEQVVLTGFNICERHDVRRSNRNRSGLSRICRASRCSKTDQQRCREDGGFHDAFLSAIECLRFHDYEHDAHVS